MSRPDTKERLKQMVIRTVDQKDARRRLSQRLRCRQAAETSADDHDSGCSL